MLLLKKHLKQGQYVRLKFLQGQFAAKNGIRERSSEVRSSTLVTIVDP